MGLSEDLVELRSRALAELNEAHDYFTESTFVWDVLRTLVITGNEISVSDKASAALASQLDIVRKSQTYVKRQLPESTFQQFISIFESFFFDFLKLWLIQYPQSLIGKQIEFKTVLEAADKDAVIEVMVHKELNEVLYERPASWFVYLQGKVKLGHPSQVEIDGFSEAKATRDTLVHNRGIANKSYLMKSGKLARCSVGERLEITEQYHRQVWELVCKMVTDISNDALAKI